MDIIYPMDTKFMARVLNQHAHFFLCVVIVVHHAMLKEDACYGPAVLLSDIVLIIHCILLLVTRLLQ